MTRTPLMAQHVPISFPSPGGRVGGVMVILVNGHNDSHTDGYSGSHSDGHYYDHIGQSGQW